MRVICWRHHHPGSRADLFARAMAAGAPGGELREVDGFAGPVPCDAAAIYGFSPRVRPIFEACRAAGVPVVLGDCGYWGAAKGRDLDTVGTIRISVDAAQPDAHWSRRPHPADRFDRPGLAVHPPRRDGRHVLLCGMSPKGWERFGLRPQQWETAAVRTMAQVTDRPILFRPKPAYAGRMRPLPGTVWSDPAIPLPALFDGAWAVVSHSSNVHLDATRYGVPGFCTAGPGRLIGSGDLSAIERPRRFDAAEQRQFLADAAWWQWTGREIADGLLWRHLRAEGLVP